MTPGGGIEPLFVSDCGNVESASVRDVAMLDWTGGVSLIFPDWDLPELDLSAFETSDGGTLADDEIAFRDAVRLRVVDLLCDFPLGASIREGEGPSDSPYNVVYVTQAASPHSHAQIGEAEYDVCNDDHGDDAIIYGAEILGLGESFTFGEWVMLFSNVIAHEIGHTLGFGHAPRVESNAPYVELMLAEHTLEEMLSEQRFMSDMTNCPEEAIQSRPIDSPRTMGCRAGSSR